MSPLRCFVSPGFMGLLISLAGCAGLGERAMPTDQARRTVDQLVANQPLANFEIAPFYTSKKEFVKLDPPYWCNGHPVGTDFQTLALTPTTDRAGGVAGFQEYSGECDPKRTSEPVAGRYTATHLYLYYTGGNGSIYQYAIKKYGAQYYFYPEKRWYSFVSLLGGEELSSERWDGGTFLSKYSSVEVDGFKPSQSDPRSSYAALRKINNDFLRNKHSDWSRSSAEIAAAESQNAGPVDLTSSIAGHINENAAALNRIGSLPTHGATASSPWVNQSAAASFSESSPRQQASDDFRAGAAKQARDTYRDLCAEHGMNEMLGHDHTDPAGYWGHCQERELSHYKSGGWLAGVQPGSVLPFTPWSSRTAACEAAKRQMVDFEKKRANGLERAKSIVERSSCVCETGIYEFKKTSNPNGWVCSIFFKQAR